MSTGLLKVVGARSPLERPKQSCPQMIEVGYRVEEEWPQRRMAAKRWVQMKAMPLRDAPIYRAGDQRHSMKADRIYSSARSGESRKKIASLSEATPTYPA